MEGEQINANTQTQQKPPQGKISSPAVFVLFIIIIGGGLIWYFQGERVAVPIEAEYPNKIVYTTNADADTEPLRQDCAARGGAFNECGSPCAPDAEICVQVCAYTCELDDGSAAIESKKDRIRIARPQLNSEVTSPLYIAGEARGNWFFEASFPVRILDGNGSEVAVFYATAHREWMVTDFVPYSSYIEFEKPATERGTLVLEKDNPSDLPEHADALRIPIIFGEAPSETTKLKAFFGSSKLNPGAEDCGLVYPVERTVPKTQGVARAALEELLKGATNREQDEGYFSSLNGGVKINTLAITDGVARVDFDEQMEYQMGGSCRVTAIRSQIIQTLMQFSTVNDVVISINGRTEDILQP